MKTRCPDCRNTDHYLGPNCPALRPTTDLSYPTNPIYRAIVDQYRHNEGMT